MEKSTLEIATSIDPSEPTLEIRLLGGFSLKIQGEAVSGLSRPAQRLLALLVLRSPTLLAREWLSEALWPESAPKLSAFYLRRSLSELRRPRQRKEASALARSRHASTRPCERLLRREGVRLISEQIGRGFSHCDDRSLQGSFAGGVR